MKFRNIIIGAAAAAPVFAAGCKPSATAYREAYESTVAAREAAFAADSVQYTQIKRNTTTIQAISGADTLQLIHVPVIVIKDGGGVNESLKVYSVVVGQFKQVFNARQMRERIADRGYPGAFVVRTGEPLYYVVALSTDNLDNAAATLRTVKGDTTLFRFRNPLPFILSRRK